MDKEELRDTIVNLLNNCCSNELVAETGGSELDLWVRLKDEKDTRFVVEIHKVFERREL